MSVPTVKGHVTQVMLKLGVTNRTQVALIVHA
jgi:DNA-binding NarL/FixJ family response regulator